MGARGRGTDGEVGKAGVRRVQRQLYRGGTTVVRGAETVSATVQHGAVISELGVSSGGFCSPRHGRQDAWGRAWRLREGL